jgi:uncharacterized protein (DUF934 family)
MALLRRDRIVDDPWTVIDDESPIPDSTPVVVSCDRWLAERDALVRRNGPLGILLRSDRSPDLIADDLDRFALVCLDFPRFTDGRAYSYARILRARYDYAGELRAVGAVLRDQLMFMRRCGFDSFRIPDNADIDGWIAAFNDFTVRYQPSVDRRPTVLQLRANGGLTALALGPHGASDVAGSWSY